MLRASHMPWDWCTTVAKPRGRQHTYIVSVNGTRYLRAKANSAGALLRQIAPDLPTGAHVAVERTR